MHPTGVYNAIIRDHGITQSNGGTIQVCVKFETECGMITGWFAMTDRAAEYTVQKINNMGFRGESLSELNDGACLVGNKCQITVDHEEYQGEQQAKVGWVNEEGYTGKEIERSADAAQDARKRFDALLHKTQKKNGNKAKTTTAADSPADDEPPF